MDSNSAKYQVAVAVKNNWFPGHTIETFDVILNKSIVVTLPVLEKEREKQNVQGKIIGYILIERGKATPKPKEKAQKEVTDK